jgi:phage-related tail protein
MVTTDIAQLSEECNTWREALRSQREEFTRMKNELQQAAAHITSKEALKDVEHYENQFNIQLTNIHDLKQSIKSHNRIPAFQPVLDDGAPPENMISGYKKLSAEYQHLRHTLHEIKNDFQKFLVNYT